MCADEWKGRLKRGSEKNKERNINPEIASYEPPFFHSRLTGATKTFLRSLTERLSSIVRAHVLTASSSRALSESLNWVYQSLLSTSLRGTRRSDSSICDTHLASCHCVSMPALSGLSKTTLYHLYPLHWFLPYLKAANSTLAGWKSFIWHLETQERIVCEIWNPTTGFGNKSSFYKNNNLELGNTYTIYIETWEHIVAEILDILISWYVKSVFHAFKGCVTVNDVIFWYYQWSTCSNIFFSPTWKSLNLHYWCHFYISQ